MTFGGSTTVSVTVIGIASGSSAAGLTSQSTKLTAFVSTGMIDFSIVAVSFFKSVW